MPRVSAIYIYPVKSCGGIAVESAAAGTYGFSGDRRFLVVDQSGQFLTQRAQPRLALVHTALSDNCLALSSPAHGSVNVDLAHTPGRRSEVTVWKDTVAADDCGDEPAQWLSAFLGLPCRLVRAGSAYARRIPDRKVPAGLAATSLGDPDSDLRSVARHEVSFADAFPFLVISEASLADLNARLEVPLPMNRFRPNLVVTGAPPYSEDEWGRFRIGEVIFHGATPCGRCAVPTIDQSTAGRGPEPLRTLATYRRNANGTVMFGRNLIHETKTGRVTVGDMVHLL
jgi:hypothetical protein